MLETDNYAVRLVDDAVGENAALWDRTGQLPDVLLHALGEAGILCGQVPTSFGGLGMSSVENGHLTAHVGMRCSSLRSVLTSQGIAAWTLLRFGDRNQHDTFLAPLTTGEVAAVALSEAGAGSDLAAMATTIRVEGTSVVVNGAKIWVTGATYAQWILVFGKCGTGNAVVVVPVDAPGVTISRIPDPLGCRAAGHANVQLESVRLPIVHLLGGAGGLPLPLLITPPLTYGRVSVAWGCVGVLRLCLAEARRHGRHRKSFGIPLVDHQLVRRHIAELYVRERVASAVSQQASQHWDEKSPEQASSAVLAKHVAAVSAATGASVAVQVLGAAGSQDEAAVARAYRDAKLMELIEGSNEISLLMLADHALRVQD